MTSAISSLNSSSQTYQVSQRQNGNDPMEKAMSGVADLLGMSTDELRDAQKDGKSLSDLAKEKGVSSDDLQSTLAKGLEENAPSGAPDDIDFDQMASDIISGNGPQGGPPRLPESDGKNNSSTDLSSLLQSAGVDSSELLKLLMDNSSSSSSSDDSNSSTDLSSLFSTSSSSTSSTDSDDFISQLQSLISKYGSKGLTHDSSV